MIYLMYIPKQLKLSAQVFPQKNEFPNWQRRHAIGHRLHHGPKGFPTAPMTEGPRDFFARKKGGLEALFRRNVTGESGVSSANSEWSFKHGKMM